MRSHLQSFRSVATQATAALAALAVGVAAAAADPILPVGGPQPSPEANPPGRVMAQADGRPDPSASTPLTPATPDMKAVQDLLGRAVDDVTTPGRSADLITLLARRDRDRIGTPGDWADVDRAVDGFRDAWQARFGLTFKLWDKIPLVISEPAVHVTGLEPTVGTPTTQPSPARKTDVNVVLADPGGHGSVTLHLVNEGTGGKTEWHFNLPDTASATSLHDALLRRLDAVTAEQARWPTDVDQAYIYVTQRALSAVDDAASSH